MTSNPKLVEEQYIDAPVDTDIESQQRTRREKELADWDADRARELAGQEGIELTQDHVLVLEVLRENYREQGLPEHAREVEELLASEFENQGGRKFLYQLFPDGPVSQGSRMAGIPVPPHAEDQGFGTAR